MECITAAMIGDICATLGIIGVAFAIAWAVRGFCGK